MRAENHLAAVSDQLVDRRKRCHDTGLVCDPAFLQRYVEELADLADVYVCDAFGSAHRAHASVAVVTKYISEKGGENAVG